MNAMYDEFHAKKSERLRSFENTVKNIFDEKLKKKKKKKEKKKKKKKKKIGDCFEEGKSLEGVTHVQIFNNNGKYYFKEVHNSFEGTLQWIDIEGLREGRHINKYYNNSRDYTKYILFRTVSLKNSNNFMCELDQDLECLGDEEELRHYRGSILLFRLCESL